MASALGVPHPASRTTKEETKMMRDIAISDRRRCIRLGCASFTGQGRLPYSRRQSRGLSCLYYAYCESWRTGLEPLLGTSASTASNQPFLIPFGQASIEAHDAGVIAVSRWIEPQDDGTGMVLLRHSRRVFCRIGRGLGEGEQGDSRSPDGYGRSPGQTTE